MKLISHGAKRGQLGRFVALSRAGVRQAPVKARRFAEEQRAPLLRTQRHDDIDVLWRNVGDALRGLPRDVDADLGQRFDGERVDLRRRRARR